MVHSINLLGIGGPNKARVAELLDSPFYIFQNCAAYVAIGPSSLGSLLLWRLAVGGWWRLLVVGSSWRLVVPGGLFLRAVLNKNTFGAS